MTFEAKKKEPVAPALTPQVQPPVPRPSAPQQGPVNPPRPMRLPGDALPAPAITTPEPAPDTSEQTASQAYLDALIKAITDATKKLDKNQAPSKATVQDIVPDIVSEAIRQGITDPAEIAVIVANASHETQLNPHSENMNYSASRAHAVFPSKFPTVKSAMPYANNPEAFGNHVYASINGNGNEASGDGYKYRGRGLIQVTGRGNYKTWNDRLSGQFKDAQGKDQDFLKNPDAMNRRDIAIRVLVEGVAQGVFRGNKVSLADYLSGKTPTADTFTDIRKKYVGKLDAATVGKVTNSIYQAIKDVPIFDPQKKTGSSGLPDSAHPRSEAATKSAKKQGEAHKSEAAKSEKTALKPEKQAGRKTLV